MNSDYLLAVPLQPPPGGGGNGDTSVSNSTKPRRRRRQQMHTSNTNPKYTEDEDEGHESEKSLRKAQLKSQRRWNLFFGFVGVMVLVFLGIVLYELYFPSHHLDDELTAFDRSQAMRMTADIANIWFNQGGRESIIALVQSLQSAATLIIDTANTLNNTGVIVSYVTLLQQILVAVRNAV